MKNKIGFFNEFAGKALIMEYIKESYVQQGTNRYKHRGFYRINLGKILPYEQKREQHTKYAGTDR